MSPRPKMAKADGVKAERTSIITDSFQRRLIAPPPISSPHASRHVRCDRRIRHPAKLVDHEKQTRQDSGQNHNADSTKHVSIEPMSHTFLLKGRLGPDVSHTPANRFRRPNKPSRGVLREW